MYKKKTSSILIGLSVVLLLLNFGLVYMTYETVTSLRNDAYVINTAGIIRGSIQRLTKLELTGCNHVCDDLIADIDNYLDKFLGGNLVDQNRESGKQFIMRLVQLNERWALLKKLLGNYRAKPSEQLKREVIMSSEQCWKIADSAVYLAQVNTEGKISAIKSFYPVVVLIVLCNILVIVFAYTTVRKKLEYRIAVDSLTKLYNREFFEQSLEIEISRSLRFNRGFSLIYFDIDRFKQINDTCGHHAGDEILVQISTLVKSSVRKIDTVCRIGGDEFAIVSSDTDQNAAMELAQKIRHIAENYSFAHVKKLTISLGIAVFDTTCSKRDLIKRADEALYLAKGNGRNRAECYSL